MMKRWVGLSFLLGLGLVWTAAAVVPRPAGGSHGGPEYLNEDPASTAPFSDAVRVGSTLYLAGNLGLGKDGKLVPGGITPEAEQTMENLKHVLEGNGSSLDRVANCEVMLADIKEREAFNEVYQRYWSPGHFPARHAFGVTGLYAGARVEIACIAVAN
jgi:2-iminobutanoate/2-iminopropanoate deaminase